MNLLQTAGAQPQRQPKYVPIFIDRAFTGIWTQRSVLHDPSDLATLRFYGGRPDALWDGSNIELSNDLTLKRRFGLSSFSCATYPTPPDTAFSFGLTNGTIQVIIDTTSSPTFTFSSVSVVGTQVRYNFSSPQSSAAGNAFIELIFNVTGFDLGVNNGAFKCVGSTANYLILSNPLGVADVSPASGISSGAVYVDLQNGCPSYTFDAVEEISGVAYYVFLSDTPAGANNGLAGQFLTISDFDNPLNNGRFEVIASTSTYVILDNPFAVTDIHVGTGASDGSMLLFAKSPGASQTHFVAVAGVLYMGDGIDIRKYTPGNPNGFIWNWSSPPPSSPPSVLIIPSGSAAIAWSASTVFSTMGLLVDPNGNTQQLYSVNGLGNNPPPAVLGTSGNGAPAFITATGSTTTDGGVTWTSQGAITLWTANTTYISGSIIFDPKTNCIFVQSHSDTRKSGPTKPAFNSTLGINGARIDDTNVSGANARWECLGVVNGSPTAVKTWSKGTVFNQYNVPSSGIDPKNVNCAIVYPLVPDLANLTAYAAGTGPAIYLLGATTQGTTANVNYNPWTGIPAPPAPGSQVAGAVTLDNQLQWLCLGSSAWLADTQVSPWSAQGRLFTCVKDSNGNMEVCTTFGVTGNVQPTWPANSPNSYGTVTQDGTAAWTCVGPPVTWQPSTQWDLPLVGFAPPSPSQPFGGSEVIGAAFTQAVISSGLSDVSTPSWQTTIGNTTADNGITWKTVAPYTQQALVWTKGHVYAYSYASRLASDPSNTVAPPGLSKPLGPPTGSETGFISTASPALVITGPNSGAVNTVSGIGSTDPQIDTIVIWRDADGGGVDNMFFLTEITAPPPISGVAQPWNFQDFLPDVATSVFPGLDNLIPAPINEENNPPPSNFLPMVYNFQRIWGASGNAVLFTGGPDVITGNPNEALNPADDFPYLAPVVRTVKNSQGLVVFLTDSVEFIGGGPLTSSFYSVTLAPGIGLLSYNNLDVYAGDIYFVSADGQFKIINPSLTLSTAGFPIGDQVAQLNTSQGYVACQQAGTDNAIYVADGSNGWWRCNPRQVPGGSSGPEPIWSPFATIYAGPNSTNLAPVIGAGMVISIEVAPGIKKLLVGGTGLNQPILQRDLTVFTDNGVQYDAFFTMGSIMLAHPGQLALLKFIEGDFSGVSFKPNVSFLLNEINNMTGFNAARTGTGVFVTMPRSVFDPPQLYGTTITPTSYSPNRYYFADTGTLARCRHMQLKVDFGKTSNGDEVYNLTIFGRLVVEI